MTRVNWPAVLCLIGVFAFWCAVAWLATYVPASRIPILATFGLLALALLGVWFDAQCVRSVGRQTRPLRWEDDEL